MKLPITIIIPFVLVISSAVTSFVVYKQNVASTDKNIRNYARQDLKLDITRLQNILYNLLTENKLAEAKVNLSVTAMNPAMQSLVLTDESNKIIAANRYIWTDSLAKDVVDFDSNIANDVKLKNKPLIFFHKDKSHILKGYYPVVLKLESKNNISQKKLGVLFAEVNIKNKLLTAQNKAVNQSMLFALSMLLTSILVAVLLHFLISRRLNTLALASEDIAKGNYDVSVQVSGNDEITYLAESYNKMMHQIKEAFASRDKSKSELEELNETLEERIERRTDLLKQAQEIAKMGNWIWYMDDNSLYWSDEVYKICGFKLGDFVLKLEDFISVVHPDDRSEILKGIENAFEKNEKYIIEHRVVLPDETVRWVREEAIPEVDRNGKRIKMTGVIRDITDEKYDIAEKEKLEREMQQMQKMESLGQLTGGIAHDFNNMLAIILGYNELAQALANKNNDEKLKDYLEQIKNSGKRASELIMKMLAFSRVSGEVSTKENISVSAMLMETEAMLKPLLSSSVSLNVQNIDGHYAIYADAAMLSQVLVNLCLNAKDAMPDGQGHIDITVEKISTSEVICSSCFNTISGNYIQISVKDNGEGISKDAVNRIFEPFFTTKEVGKGTGMGLAMVHGLIHKNDGHLNVESKKGHGSTFKLLFPMVDANQLKEQENSNLQVDADNDSKGRLLIVDDEEAITHFLKDFLEAKGFSVIAMNDSKEALEYFIQHDKEIDLVISDFTMPGMTGLQLSEYMLTHNPNMPIIMCSGYSDDLNEDKVLEKNLKAYLQKPVNTALLLKEIKNNIL